MFTQGQQAQNIFYICWFSLHCCATAKYVPHSYNNNVTNMIYLDHFLAQRGQLSLFLRHLHLLSFMKGQISGRKSGLTEFS